MNKSRVSLHVFLGAAAVLLLAGTVAVSFAQNRDGHSSKKNAAVCGKDREGLFRCHARVIVDEVNGPNGQTEDIPKIVEDRRITSTALPPGYGPAQFRGAYQLTGIAGSREIIAIVDAYDQPNIKADLDKYSSTYGIPSLPACAGSVASSPAPCFQKVSQTGGTSYPQFNSGWGLEISLDVEAAHAACQNCSILLVEANSATYANLMAAEDEAVALGANVVSNSFGSGEFSGETAYDAHFNHTGVAFTVSSGDGGYGVEYPAASRYVTAVGGTTLSLGSDNTYQSESAWSGSGSGCSAYESKPSWQADAGCANRTVADVSADADPNTGAAVLDSCYKKSRRGCSGGWFEVGGTSLSSPLIAGVYALGGISSLSQGNSLPYLQNPGANLHDITAGNNGNCGGSYLCTSLSGYDGPTGLGTPNGTGAF